MITSYWYLYFQRYSNFWRDFPAFPGPPDVISRTKVIFQDFPGPGNMTKKPALLRTLQEAWETWQSYEQSMWIKSAIHNIQLTAQTGTFSIFTFWILVNISFWFLANVDTEHHNFWRHCWHFVAEAIFIHTVHVCSERVLAVRFSLARIDGFTIWPDNLHKSQINNYHVSSRSKSWK